MDNYIPFQLKKKICKVFKDNDLKITIEANKKVIDFLDVTFNLETGRYQPYLKPGNNIQYINVKSNHPPNVIKAVPEGINKRLSAISADEETFKAAAPIYQDALQKSGFSYILEYKNDNNAAGATKTSGRKRKRKVTWYNPPFDLRVKTNIGRVFLTILDNSFKQNNPLRKIFNRNTVKLSYSCMPNVKNIIENHNKKQLNKIDERKETTNCNCRDKAKCPLDGKCKDKCLVYQATVITEGEENNGRKNETYVGLTETDFKTRLANHKQSFNNAKLKNATELSKYIWPIKEKHINYKVSWKILGHAMPYSTKTKRCNLCTLEKYFILCHKDKASLNQRSGLVNCCRHFSKFLLSHHPT